MENSIRPINANLSKNFVKKSIKQAYRELHNSPQMSVRQYAQDKKINLYDAQAIDLNDDSFIDLSERASEICAKKALKMKKAKTGDIPSMVLMLVQDKFGLKKAQEQFMRMNYPKNSINISA